MGEEQVANEILSYLEMCQRERCSLQRGMNFRLSPGYSVILMSRRHDAPYRDQLEEDGSVLVYEGHDEPRRRRDLDPKSVDQPEFQPNGRPTQNGLFHRAAHEFKRGERPVETVRAYEKVRQGIWSYNGVFELVDSWRESDGVRLVFRFKLIAIEDVEMDPIAPRHDPVRRRIIPSHVKVEVWKRDGGRCVKCGATDELHFDHDVPFSKGGTSITAANVQLLCARHNLEKKDSIA